MEPTQQNTIHKICEFEGKGLHTGLYTHMKVKPAPENSGIVFHRTDLGKDALIPAIAENVSNTARSTTIANGGASVITIEHLMSALTGLGIDNALVEIDNSEVPILDGSAKPYVKAFLEAGICSQNAERRYTVIKEELTIKDDISGSWIKLEPAEDTSYDITLDFNSKVLGEQNVVWDGKEGYAEEIGPCRTFVFFHELEALFKNNLIKGGDVDNAIVVVENPVSEDQLANICSLFDKPKININGNGYLDNLELRFDDECGRHKLMDLIGDLRLCGMLKARITAYKPGHGLNTRAAKAVSSAVSTK